jgi:hypothetical protein
VIPRRLTVLIEPVGEPVEDGHHARDVSHVKRHRVPVSGVEIRNASTRSNPDDGSQDGAQLSSSDRAGDNRISSGDTARGMRVTAACAYPASSAAPPNSSGRFLI